MKANVASIVCADAVCADFVCAVCADAVFFVFTGIVAEQFLNNTATQLTYHGLCELTSTVQEGELCVFFRNNHFSTMTKHKVSGYKQCLSRRSVLVGVMLRGLRPAPFLEAKGDFSVPALERKSCGFFELVLSNSYLTQQGPGGTANDSSAGVLRPLSLKGFS